MSKQFLSPFQLLDSWIESISFDVIDPSLTDNSASITLGHYFNEDELRQDGIWAVKGNVSVECEWSNEAGKVVCQGTCTVRGAVSVFESAFESECSDDERKLTLHANMIALLFGKARNVLEFLSANSQVGKKTLPSIDPYAYLEPGPEGAVEN